MIGYSYRRRKGGRRFAASDRVALRSAASAGLPETLTPAAVAAMTDPAGIDVLFEASFEVESNRLNRPVTVKLHEIRSGTDTEILDPSAFHVLDSASLGTNGSAGVGRMYPSYLVDSKRNADEAFAVADAYRADESVCFDNYTTPWESVPVSFSRQYAGGVATAYNGDARTAVAAGARGEWRIGTDASSIVLSRSTDQGDPGRLGDSDAITAAYEPKGGEWYATNAGGIVAAGLTTVFPKVAASTRYRIPASGSRSFVVSAQVANDKSTTYTPALRVTLSTGETVNLTGTATVVSGPPAVGLFSQVSSVFTVTGTPGATVTSIMPRINVGTGTNGTDPTRVEVTKIAAYAGDQVRDAVFGVESAVPSSPVYVLLDTSAGNPWNVNQIDVVGDSIASRITSATVDVQTSPGGAWVPLNAVAAGANGVSVKLDTPQLVYGLKVWIEESTSGEGGFTYLTEVDAMFVRDVTDDVESADLEWSRETDPGSADSPVGNFESSSLSLTLDNTSGAWNPSANAALDVGHRIEAAIGVRYSNTLENPRGDTNLAGWSDLSGSASGAVLSRVVFDPAEGAPSPTGFVDTMPVSPTSGTIYLGTDRFDVTPGQILRVGSWMRVEGPADATATLGIQWIGGVTTKSSTVAVGTGWQYRTFDFTVPAGVTQTYLVYDTSTAPTSPQTLTLKITNASVQILENGSPVVWEELVSAGVFYSLPYDTDSTSTTVTIQANDVLTTRGSTEVASPVLLNRTLESEIRRLALRYLDLAHDQVVVDSSIAATRFPYLYPTGDVGTYLADLAKSVMATLIMDGYDRLVVAPYGYATGDPVAEIRADNALISHRRPPGYDVTTSRVHVAAAPLKLGTDTELWSLSEPITIADGGADVPVAAFYSDAPALNQYLTGYDYDPGIIVSDVHHYAGFSTFTIMRDATAPAGQSVTFRGLAVNGTPLVEGTLDVVKEHAPSVARYGNRTLEIDARLAQTQTQVDAAATLLLDAFRSLDDSGNRRVPDLSIDALGMFHLEAGDKVTAQDPDRGLGSDYTILGRKLTYAGGALLLSDTRLRESSTTPFAIASVSVADDTNAVAAY